MTFRAAAAVLVEREEGRSVAVDLGVLLLGEELADVIIDLEISHGVGAGALPYRILIDIFNILDAVGVAGDFPEYSRKVAGLVDHAVERRIEDVPHKGRLATAADSRHDGQHSQRELHIYILKIVLLSTFHGD